MVNTCKLKKAISDNNYSQAIVARTLGLSYYGFKKKVNNVTSFTIEEMYCLCKMLDITDIDDIKTIFFTGDVKTKKITFI